MKLQFDANQEYQLDAIRAVVGLFDGQPDASQSAVPMADSAALSSLRLSESGVSNQCVLTESQWLSNLQAVQKANGIEPSAALAPLQLDDGTIGGDFPNFTVHDFRRTARTHLAALGVLPHIGERCLNHKVKGVEGIYNRHDFFEERKEALQKWADLLDQLERGGAEIVELRKAKAAK